MLSCVHVYCVHVCCTRAYIARCTLIQYSLCCTHVNVSYVAGACVVTTYEYYTRVVMHALMPVRVPHAVPQQAHTVRTWSRVCCTTVYVLRMFLVRVQVLNACVFVVCTLMLWKYFLHAFWLMLTKSAFAALAGMRMRFCSGNILHLRTYRTVPYVFNLCKCFACVCIFFARVARHVCVGVNVATRVVVLLWHRCGLCRHALKRKYQQGVRVRGCVHVRIPALQSILRINILYLRGGRWCWRTQPAS